MGRVLKTIIKDWDNSIAHPRVTEVPPALCLPTSSQPGLGRDEVSLQLPLCCRAGDVGQGSEQGQVSHQESSLRALICCDRKMKKTMALHPLPERGTPSLLWV